MTTTGNEFEDFNNPNSGSFNMSEFDELNQHLMDTSPVSEDFTSINPEFTTPDAVIPSDTDIDVNLAENNGFFSDASRDLKKFGKNVGGVLSVLREELEGAPLRVKTAAVGSIALLGAHELGMEFVMGRVGVWSFSKWQNPFITGGVNSMTSIAVESALTLGISYSLMKNKETSKEISLRFQEPEETIENGELAADEDPDKDITSSGNKFTEAYDTFGLLVGLGSPGIILRDQSRKGEKTFKENVKTGAKAVGALAVANFILATGASGSIWLSENVFHTYDIANWALPALKNPLTYLGIFGLTRSLAYRKKRSDRLNENKSDDLNYGTEQAINENGRSFA